MRYFRLWPRLLCLLLILTLLPQGSPLPADDDVSRTVDNLVNTDFKLRAGRMVIDQVKEDRAAGRSIQWGKVRQKLTDRPFLTQAGLELGSQAAGSAIQWATMGLFPPLGVVLGTVASGIISSSGAALGYEASQVMEKGQRLSKRQLVGQALQNIDAPQLLGKTAGSVIGAMIGQAICPIPFLGVMIGTMAGGFLGGLVANKLRGIEQVGRAFDRLQSAWQALGAKIGGNPAPPGIPEPAAAGTVRAPAAVRTLSPGLSSAQGRDGELQAARLELEALYRRYAAAAADRNPDAGSLRQIEQQLAAARTRLRELERR